MRRVKAQPNQMRKTLLVGSKPKKMRTATKLIYLILIVILSETTGGLNG
jgi:hypothetical protein